MHYYLLETLRKEGNNVYRVFVCEFLNYFAISVVPSIVQKNMLREVSLCKVFGSIEFRGRMYTVATMSIKGVSSLTATYSSSRSG